MSDTIAEHDERQRYCPALGHEVDFAYCRSTGSAQPCGRMLDCWWEVFDIAAFVRANYGPETLQRLSSPRPGKAATLLDLVRQAQQRSQGTSDSSAGS
jgi:hypothetical protein